MQIKLNTLEELLDDMEAGNIKPGIYPSVPFPIYCKIDAVNQTSLKVINDFSPFEYRCRLSEDEDTAARQFGRGVHTAWLEPHEFRQKYAVWPHDRRGARWEALKLTHKFGAKQANQSIGVSLANSRNCKEWRGERWDKRQTILLLAKEHTQIGCFIRENDTVENPFSSRELITEDERDAIMEAAETLAKHPLTRKLQPGADRQQWRELTLIWEEDGRLCKARLDLVHIGKDLMPYIYDLKTTRRKTRQEFARDAHALGYDFQAEWYSRGFRKLTGVRLEAHQFRFLTIETDHLDVNDYWLPEQAFDFGRVAVDRSLETLSICEDTGRWPGANNDQAEELYEYFPFKIGNGATAASLDGFDEPSALPESEEPAFADNLH